MAKSRLGASYWQLIPTMEGLEKAVSEEMEKATKDGYAVPVDPVVETEKLDEEMGKSGDKSGKLYGENFKAAFVASGAILAATALTGKALYDIGDQFDGIGDSIQISTGKTGEELENLKGIATDVFTSIPTSTEEAGVAVAALSQRLGYSGKELETVSKQILEAGRMQGVAVDVNEMSDAFLQFGITADQAEGSLDKAFAASQKSGTNLNDILSKVSGSSAQLKGLNLGFDESISLISSLSAAGLDVDTTLAQMGKGIVTFAKEGQPANEAIQGVVGEIGRLIDAGDQAAAIDLASQFFGTKGALNMVNAIQTGAVSAESFTSNMGELNNTILGTAEDTNDFAEKWQVLQNKGMEALEPLGTAVLDLATSLLEDAGPALEDITAVVADMAKFFAENEWAIAAAATVIGGVLVVALVAATVAAWAFAAPFIANPITLWATVAIIALGALIAAFGWLVDNWDGVVQFFSDTIGNIGAFFGTVFGEIGNFFSDLYEAQFNSILGIMGFLTNLGAAVGGFFAGVADFIVQTFISVANFVIDLINSVIQAINSAISFVPNLFGADWSGPLGTIPRMAEGGTVLPTSGGTLAVLAEAGRAETVVDTGNMNALIESILSDGGAGGTGGAPQINLYITQKEEQSMKDFIEELIKEIQFQLTGGGQYSYA